MVDEVTISGSSALGLQLARGATIEGSGDSMVAGVEGAGTIKVDTEAAGKLQRAGLIHYSRGKITVVNRPGLEARVCECYAVVKKEFDRLLPEEIIR